MELDNLEQLHQTQLEMLDVIDNICRENNISYFLDSGSALGAIRHGGFIPWDDDIDIGMLRDDYDVFLRIAPSVLPINLELQNEKTEPNYYLFYSKIRKLNTFFPQSFPDDREKNFRNRGIQIDIFPFDYVSDVPIIANIHMSFARLYRKIVEVRLINSVPKRKVKRILYYIIRIIPRNIIREHFNHILRKHNSSKSSTVASFTYRMARKKNYSFPLNVMVPVKKIEFEDRQYLIMNDPDYYLRKMYGDYMKLPPEEERHSHLAGNIIYNLYK